MKARSLCRSDSLEAVARELAMYALDLVGVQPKWDKGGTEKADTYTFYTEGGNAHHRFGIRFFCT